MIVVSLWCIYCYAKLVIGAIANQQIKKTISKPHLVDYQISFYHPPFQRKGSTAHSITPLCSEKLSVSAFYPVSFWKLLEKCRVVPENHCCSNQEFETPSEQCAVTQDHKWDSLPHSIQPVLFFFRPLIFIFPQIILQRYNFGHECSKKWLFLALKDREGFMDEGVHFSWELKSIERWMSETLQANGGMWGSEGPEVRESRADRPVTGWAGLQN